MRRSPARWKVRVSFSCVKMIPLISEYIAPCAPHSSWGMLKGDGFDRVSARLSGLARLGVLLYGGPYPGGSAQGPVEAVAPLRLADPHGPVHARPEFSASGGRTVVDDLGTGSGRVRRRLLAGIAPEATGRPHARDFPSGRAATVRERSALIIRRSLPYGRGSDQGRFVWTRLNAGAFADGLLQFGLTCP